MAMETSRPRRRRKCSLPTVPDVTPALEALPESESYTRGYKLPVDSQPLFPINTPVPLETYRRKRRRMDSQPLVSIHTPMPLSQPLVPIHTPLQVQLPAWRGTAQARPSRWSRRCRVGLELFVLITFIVFMLRLFLGEAFLVPTGSMSPTLLGHHKAGVCPCCGHAVKVGRWGSGLPEQEAAEMKEAQRQYHHACCANCGWDQLQLEKVPESAGDRLLVHKHLFRLRAPQRWELAVFQHPGLLPDAQEMTYVKRLVGLPGETVQVRQGEVYINGKLARKSLREVREMRQLVYDDAHLPQDAPVPFRWQGEQVKEERSKRAYVLQPIAQGTEYAWLAYRHLVRGMGPEHGSWVEGEITDQQGGTGERQGRHAVHDLLITGEIEPQGATWFAVAFTDGWDDFLVEIPLGTDPRPARLTVRPASRGEEGKGLAEEAGKTMVLSPQKAAVVGKEPTAFEVGCVDRCIFVTVDGQPLFRGQPLPEADPGRARQPLRGPLAVSGQGPVSLGARGGALRVKQLQLYRDIHYTGGTAPETFPHGVQAPVRLGAGEFFVLGDNSANSYDSRCWPHSPVVRAEWIIGKPCLIHFPFRWAETDLGGQRRLWAMPDWSRVRILR